MCDERKKSAGTFWITMALITALVGYPSSRALVISLQKIDWLAKPMSEYERTFHGPLIEIYNDGPEPFRGAVRWCIQLLLR
jgi:hypothetical protein